MLEFKLVSSSKRIALYTVAVAAMIRSAISGAFVGAPWFQLVLHLDYYVVNCGVLGSNL
jgi:hypothetical protein